VLDHIQPQKRVFTQWRDPLTIEFALREDYSNSDNPISPIGFSLISQTAGANIGNLTFGGGIDAAFDGNLSKPAVRSAFGITPVSSFQNFVGKAWNAPTNTGPASLFSPITYNVVSFSVYAPSDAALGSSALQLQGSNDAVNWVTLYSTTSARTIGEIINSISSNLTTGNFQNHRIALAGGTASIAVAQAQFNVATTGINEE
jgi:hypothetical protein